MQRIFPLSAIVLAVALASTAALISTAAASDYTGWYLGAGIGYGYPSVRVTVSNERGTVARATTDKKGNVTFPDLAPGHYTLEIDGKSLVAVLDRAGPPPEKKNDGGGLSIGIGGSLFGGGGHGGSGHPGAGGGSGHGGSGGGVGVGMTIPLGGGGSPDTHPTAPTLEIAVGSPTPAQADVGVYSASPITAVNQDFHVSLPYCRDSAQQGIRVGLTVPSDTAPGGTHDDLGRTIFVGVTVKY